MAENGHSNKRFKSSNEHPAEILQQKAEAIGCKVTDLEFAKHMDKEDPLRHLREEFCYPKNKTLPKADLSLVDPEEESVYLCGNSLGLMPKRVPELINRELDKWARIAVNGHFMGEMPWALCDEVIDTNMSSIVGAKREEVTLMNGLTVNLHLLLVSFYRPTAQRHKILLESKAFPSDHYAFESQIRFHGYDPSTSMICMEPREGELTLRTEDILAKIEEEGDSIALVCFSGVQYYTGQLFNIEAITKAGQKKGCHVGFDLAHAVGNVELYLHDWNVDFACWCNYKYISGSAGAIAGFYMHERFANNEYPKLLGWWGHDMKSRFEMDNVMKLSPGPRGYRISNPPPLLCAPLEASLLVYKKTTQSDLKKKSRLLTGYLELLLKVLYSKPAEPDCKRPYVTIITPSDPDQRGCQLSLMFSVPIKHVFEELQKRGVSCDERLPNVIRIAPVHIYNSFEDVHRFLTYLGQSLEAAKDQE